MALTRLGLGGSSANYTRPFAAKAAAAVTLLVNQYRRWIQMNPDFYTKWDAITPSDTANFPSGVCDAIRVGGAGNLVAVDEGGNPVTFAVIAGEILPIRAKRVNSTSTTATGLHALYRR